LALGSEFEGRFAMRAFGHNSIVLACGAALLALPGCSAPMGPIGGPELASCSFLKCCHYAVPGTCDENDPTIVPPHSNFHPLPTRPVFSPPESIPGVYAPWPGGEVIPPREIPAEPLEVQASPRSSDEPPPPPRAALSSSDTDPHLAPGKNLTLRR
jgi:hypothetical protein